MIVFETLGEPNGPHDAKTYKFWHRQKKTASMNACRDFFSNTDAYYILLTLCTNFSIAATCSGCNAKDGSCVTVSMFTP